MTTTTAPAPTTLRGSATVRLSLRQLLAHKARLALTVTAVTLGVAFVSGAFVLSDTMNTAFDQLFGSAAQGSDLTVRARMHGTADDAHGAAMGGMTHRPIADTVVTTVRDLPGVQTAEGTVTGYALVLDKEGKPVASDAGTLGSSLHTDHDLGTPYTVRSGYAPHGPHQVALDAATARKAGYRPGDTVRLVLESGKATFTLAGTVHVGTGQGSTLGGATMAAFDLPTAQHVLGRDGKVDKVDIRADRGVDIDELRDRVSAALPAGVEAVTTAQVTGESAKAVRDNLSMFTTILVAFAAVSLLVGAFVIWNTFSVLVAQRRREVALMRAVGATRRQVLTGLVAEATGIGLASSLLGLATGAGVAVGLLAVLQATGVDLPSTHPVISGRTVLVALTVGLVVTIAAALVPAAAATRVAPVEALRDAVPGAGVLSRRRGLAGLAVLAASAGTLAAATVVPDHSGLAVLGALLGFAGLVLAGPTLARGLAGVVDRAAGARRGVGGWRMAARNVARAPQRAAATALALTIGLAVVVAATVVAASMNASVADAVRAGNRADLLLKPAGMMGGITPAVTTTLRKDQAGLDVAAVAPLRFASATASPAGPHATTRRATSATVGAVDPAATAQVLDLDLRAGSLAALRPGSVLLSVKQAAKVDAHVGDPVTVLFPETGRRTFTVAGIFGRDTLVGAGYLLSTADLQANVTSRLDSAVLVRYTAGADPAAAKDRVVRALHGFPDVVVKDQSEFVAEQQAQVDQLLGLVTAMLLLAIVIAVLGIINTLVLSVLERTRELGLLRAVGATRRQVRAVVRREALLMAALGALSGVALGATVGAAAARSLDGKGITSLAVSAGQLAAYMAVATLVGGLAAIAPARRASRVDVLRAITVE
ncbi:MAG: ABC transporter permease [Actinomycetes bacterium]